MGETRHKHVKECLKWILMVSVSPIALLVFMLMTLYSLLRFLCKVALLFIIVAINTPFAVMYNLSVLVFQYTLTRIRNSDSNPTQWNSSDPRASLGIEVKLLFSNFLKVVAGELLLTVSTGVITYFTAPRYVFYISMSVGVTVILHKWLNTNCLSKTALSCLCDGYGLSPLMFLFSFIGLFDIGCHPVAKCSFAASRAFLFVKDEPIPYVKDEPILYVKDKPDQYDEEVSTGGVYDQTILFEEGSKESNIEQDHTQLNGKDGPNVDLEPSNHRNRFNRLFEINDDPIEVVIEEGDTELNGKDGPKVDLEPSNRRNRFNRLFEINDDPIEVFIEERGTEVNEKDGPKVDLEPSNHDHRRNPHLRLFEIRNDQIDDFTDKDFSAPNQKYGIEPVPSSSLFEMDQKGDKEEMVHISVNLKEGNKKLNFEVHRDHFNRAQIDPKQQFIEFLNWNAFERGLFKLNPRIDFIIRNHDGKYQYILESFMVLKLLGVNLCKYPVERLELPEDYTKANELFNFLHVLSANDGFVTNKMRGRYEHSLTLLEITEGVQENDGYKIVRPVDKRFVVAGRTDVQ